jgi:hypothetical protein
MLQVEQAAGPPSLARLALHLRGTQSSAKALELVAAGVRAAADLERQRQMENNWLQWASRCGARGTRFVSTGAGPASPQARGGAGAAAYRMVGGVRLALLGNAASV